MNCKNYVYLKQDETEYVFYEGLFGKNGGFGYKIGNVVLDISMLSEDVVKGAYTYIGKELIDNHFNDNRHDFQKTVFDMIVEMDTNLPALHFHTISFCYLAERAIIDKKYVETLTLEQINYFDTIWQHADEIEKTIEETSEMDYSLYFGFLIDLLGESVKILKKEIEYELRRIKQYSEKIEYQELTPAQRLYYLDNVKYKNQGLQYTGTSYQVCLKPQILDTILLFDEDPNEFAQSISNSHLELIEAYEINNVRDLIRFEFIRIILLDKQLKICQNCEGYFIPRGRPDIKYCDRIPEGEEQTCAEIGAARSFKEKVDTNPAYAAYQTAYKRMSSRVKYGFLTRQEFLSWAKEARMYRAQCVVGKISINEYEIWLRESGKMITGKY